MSYVTGYKHLDLYQNVVFSHICVVVVHVLGRRFWKIENIAQLRSVGSGYNHVVDFGNIHT